MTRYDLRAWLAELGLTTTTAAVALGCTRRTIERRQSGKYAIPREAALACAAVAAGLGPWRRERKKGSGAGK
jgi:plasmid maintenance system antidote protein VapI